MSKKNKKVKQEHLGTVQSGFINLASHQLRTPLSGMKWLLELLQKNDSANLSKKQKDFIEKIYASNEKMIALVNDLLEVARLEMGETKLYLQPTDLTGVIRSILKEKEREIKKRTIQVVFTTEQEPFPFVRTELNKIKQAVANIINNAVLYSKEAGQVRIDLKKQDDMIIARISDDGIGIPKNQQKLIFTKFFRGENTSKIESQGTGLGLFISKAFIEASGGKIWFHSEENKGTVFYFTLPIAK